MFNSVLTRINRARLAVAAGVGALALALTTLVGIGPAQASQVSGCSGWTVNGYAACVYADMGSKNYSNHRQWVGSVRVTSHAYNPTKLEIWGDGFYRQLSSPSRPSTHSWYIGKWVDSGTNICGATTVGTRYVACIHISV